MKSHTNSDFQLLTQLESFLVFLFVLLFLVNNRTYSLFSKETCSYNNLITQHHLNFSLINSKFLNIEPREIFKIHPFLIGERCLQ